MSIDTTCIPKAFFQVTNCGQLIRYTNDEGQLINERSPRGPDTNAEELTPFETCYRVLQDESLDGTVLMRQLEQDGSGFMIIPLEEWTEDGFWTAEEKTARNICSSWQRGHYAGLERACGLVQHHLQPLVALCEGRRK